MAGALVPEDDLYARLEVDVDASPEAIELAWRALLKRHHPDVAGDTEHSLERAKRINVAHDWLSDAGLRSRYDRERLGLDAIPARGRTGVRHGRPPRAWPPRPAARRRRPRAAIDAPGPRPRRAGGATRPVPRPRAAAAPDELDRLAAPSRRRSRSWRRSGASSRPRPPAAFEAAEVAVAARVPPERWAEVGLREGLLGVSAELVLAPFLDDTLAEPFRGRARDRLLRAWEASDRPAALRADGAEVAAIRARTASMTAPEVATLLHASAGIPGDDRPWPAALPTSTRDEALRISAILAGRDVAMALPDLGLAPATATRARRLLGRAGHVAALRHAFPAATYASLMAPFAAATGGPVARAANGGRGAEAPGVRRAR